MENTGELNPKNIPRKKEEYHGCLPLRIAGILLALTLPTGWYVSEMAAKFISGSPSQSTADVAAFKITEDGTWSQGLTVYISPGSPQNYVTIMITNESEVAVDYTVEITNESQNIGLLTFGLQKKGDDNKNLLSPDTSDFSFSENAAPNESTPTIYYFYFDWPSDENDPDSNLDYMGMVDYFTITVSAKQVD